MEMHFILSRVLVKDCYLTICLFLYEYLFIEHMIFRTQLGIFSYTIFFLNFLSNSYQIFIKFLIKFIFSNQIYFLTKSIILKYFF